MEPPAPVTKTVFPATVFSQSKEGVKSGRSRKFDHSITGVLIEAGRRRSGLPVALWVKVIGWVDDNHRSEICGANIFAKLFDKAANWPRFGCLMQRIQFLL